jgi:hypothetical protein
MPLSLPLPYFLTKNPILTTEMSAMRFNPICKAFDRALSSPRQASDRHHRSHHEHSLRSYHVLEAHPLPVYGVLKHQKPFDPNYLKNHEKIA